MRSVVLSAVVIVLLVQPVLASAQEMRRMNPIATPAAVPAGAEVVAAPKPIQAAATKTAVEQLAGKWNVSDLGAALSENFYDKSRFMDAMVTSVPRDTRMRVNSVGGVQTIQQMIVDDPQGGKLRISTVTATAATQLELNDPAQGFVRVPGTNEILFDVIERIE